jgi:hypothetical protein
MPALTNPRHERFYVYAVRIDGRTRYVGKGCGGRAFVHLRSSHNPVLRAEIDAARATGLRVRVRLVAQDMTEREAFRLERRMIAKWAARLVNVSMGSHTEMERLAMECRANLQTLKTEDQVWREGAHMGVSAADRVRHLRDIRCHLQQMAEAA